MSQASGSKRDHHESQGEETLSSPGVACENEDAPRKRRRNGSPRQAPSMPLRLRNHFRCRGSLRPYYCVSLCFHFSHNVNKQLCTQKSCSAGLFYVMCAKETSFVSCVRKRNTFCFLCVQKKHVLFPVCAKETRSVSCVRKRNTFCFLRFKI